MPQTATTTKKKQKNEQELDITSQNADQLQKTTTQEEKKKDVKDQKSKIYSTTRRKKGKGGLPKDVEQLLKEWDDFEKNLDTKRKQESKHKLLKTRSDSAPSIISTDEKEKKKKKKKKSSTQDADKKNETPQEQPSEPKTPPASPRRKLVRNVSWSDEIPMREPEENGNDKPKETTTTDPSPVRASFQRKLQVERYTPRFAVPDASKQQACQDDDDDEDGNVGDKDKEGNAGDEKKN